MRSDPLMKIFVPLRFVAGLALVAVGSAWLLAIVLFAEHVRLVTLAAGPFFIALGVGVAAASRADACAACRVVLEQSLIDVPIEMDALAQAAVRATERGAVDGVVALGTAPLTAAGAARTASVHLDYCPTCKQIGRLFAGHRRHRNGFSSTEHLSRPVILSGWMVSYILGTMTVRNEAWTRAVYGGPTS